MNVKEGVPFDMCVEVKDSAGQPVVGVPVFLDSIAFHSDAGTTTLFPAGYQVYADNQWISGEKARMKQLLFPYSMKMKDGKETL